MQQLTDAIEELPPQERMAVTLYYREEMRLREISEMMKLSPSRISRILSRAMFDLGEKLRAKGMDGGRAARRRPLGLAKAPHAYRVRVGPNPHDASCGLARSRRTTAPVDMPGPPSA